MSIIDEYKAIADRLKIIPIEEGRLRCPTCQSIGWHQYCDEEGALYYTECDTCKNPMKLKPPTASYSG